MSVEITALPNGLRIATDSMPGAESVAAGAWVATGTRDEPWAANGIAHLVEHMMFKGTKSRSAYKISTTIEKNGGSMNAHTTREETAYYARVLPEDTERAFDIIADMLQHSVFDEKELKREKQVIIQEIGRDLDSPEEHVFDIAQQQAYPNQRLGRPILGSSPVIEKMPRRAVADYVKRHYNANTMIVVATGRVKHTEIVALAKKYFGKLPSGKAPQRDAARAKFGARYVQKDIEQLHLIMSFFGTSSHGKQLAATQLLSILLGGNSSSRLFQKVREKRGLVYTVSAAHNSFSDGGLFQIYAGTDPERVGELIPAVCAEMVDVTRNVSKAELDRAKAQMRADVLMGKESVMRSADNLGHQMVTYGKPISAESILARVASVTKDDVEGVAQKLIRIKPVITALGPLKEVEDYDSIVKRLRV